MLGLVVDAQSFVVTEQRNNSGSSHGSVSVAGGDSGSCSKTGGSSLLAALFGILALLLAIMFAMN